MHCVYIQKRFLILCLYFHNNKIALYPFMLSVSFSSFSLFFARYLCVVFLFFHCILKITQTMCLYIYAHIQSLAFSCNKTIQCLIYVRSHNNRIYIVVSIISHNIVAFLQFCYYCSNTKHTWIENTYVYHTPNRGDSFHCAYAQSKSQKNRLSLCHRRRRKIIVYIGWKKVE